MKKFGPLVFLLVGGLLSCGDREKPFDNLPPPEFGPVAIRMMQPQMGGANPHNPHGASENPPPVMEKPVQNQAANDRGGVVTGRIEVERRLAAKVSAGPKVLFVIARSPQGGPPLAVKRLVVNEFPVAFSIGESDMMSPGTKLEGDLKISARLDFDGSAGPPQPGDIEGVLADPVTLGSRDLRLVLNKAY